MDDLVTTAEAAELLKVQMNTLAVWRLHGRGPRFYKLGRSVRYRRSDLAAYLGGPLRSTSDQRH